jgi:hypothetical protein
MPIPVVAGTDQPRTARRAALPSVEAPATHSAPSPAASAVDTPPTAMAAPTSTASTALLRPDVAELVAPRVPEEVPAPALAMPRGPARSEPGPIDAARRDDARPAAPIPANTLPDEDVPSAPVPATQRTADTTVHRLPPPAVDGRAAGPAGPAVRWSALTSTAEPVPPKGEDVQGTEDRDDRSRVPVRTVAIADAREVGSLGAKPPKRASPVPATVAASTALPVDVHIGTIEIRAAAQGPVNGPMPDPPGPRVADGPPEVGFESFGSLRSYAPWRR